MNGHNTKYTQKKWAMVLSQILQKAHDPTADRPFFLLNENTA